jgi:SPP1 gp7 family putative phage head morphogenesis protein
MLKSSPKLDYLVAPKPAPEVTILRLTDEEKAAASVAAARERADRTTAFGTPLSAYAETPVFQGGSTGKDAIIPPVATDYTYPAAYGISCWVYVAVTAIATACAQAEIVVERLVGSEWEPAPDSKLARTLAYINSDEDDYSIWEGLLIDLLTYGNAWWLLLRPEHDIEKGLTEPDFLARRGDRARTANHYDAKGNRSQADAYKAAKKPEGEATIPPSALQRILPFYCTVAPGLGFRSNLTAFYQVVTGPGLKFYGDTDMVQFKLGSATDPYYGQSPIMVVERKIKAQLAADKFNEAWLNSGGTPQTALIPEDGMDWNQDQRVRFAQSWYQSRSPQSAGLPLFLPAGAKDIKAIGMNPDVGLLSTFPDTMRDAILSTYRVPAAVAMVQISGTGLNSDQASQQKKSFWSGTVIPHLKRIAAAINSQLAWQYPGEGQLRVRFETSNIAELQEDLADQVKVAQSLMGIWPLNSILEKVFAMPPVEGGENVFMPGTVKTIDQILNPPAPPPMLATPQAEGDNSTDDNPQVEPATPAPSRGQEGGSDQLSYEIVRTKDSMTSDGPSGSGSDLVPQVWPEGSKPKKRIRKFPQELRVKTYHERNGRRDILTAHVKQVVSLWYEERGHAVIAALHADPSLKSFRPFLTKGAAENADEYLGGFTGQSKALADDLIPFLSDAYAAEGQSAANDIGAGIDFNIQNPRATAALDQREVRITTVARDAQERVRDDLIDGLNHGETEAQLTDRVSEWIKVGKEGYAQNVARTETGSALNAGAMDGYQQAGATHKEWLSIMDDRTREAHAEADGQTVVMDDSFEVDGESLDYPGDPSGSAENCCMCRCSISAGFEDDDSGQDAPPDEPASSPAAVESNRPDSEELWSTTIPGGL